MTAEPATVTEFDGDRGLGSVVTADGRPYRFHCTAITDGTRRIEPDTAVMVEIGPAGPGQWEAVSVIKVAPDHR